MQSIPGLIPAAHNNRQDWWHSPVTLLLGDKDIEWLEKSSLNALLVSLIHIDVDFKSGLCYTAGIRIHDPDCLVGHFTGSYGQP